MSQRWRCRRGCWACFGFSVGGSKSVVESVNMKISVVHIQRQSEMTPLITVLE